MPKNITPKAEKEKIAKDGRKKRKPGKRAQTLPDHPEGRTDLIGHEERLALQVKLALQFKRAGLYHYEIAERIQEALQLERLPAITTVADWLKRGGDAVARDIQELQWQMRIDQFNQLEQLKGKWLPLALEAHLEVKRWKMIEGSLQPELDENAVREQIEATKQVVNIMNRQAKLLGLDIEKAATNGEDGPDSLQALQLWMIGQVNVIGGAAPGGNIEAPSDILELRSGLPEIEEAEVIENDSSI